jgi:DNA-binding CsgD family transcriptional regulator
MPSDHNDLLLRLYRLSHEWPLDRFQDEALELLKPVLPFDSAMWGAATLTNTGIDVHTIHLHRQPPEMLQAYEDIKHLDTAALWAARHPSFTNGFHAPSWFSDPGQRALLDYGKRFGQTHFFISGALQPATRFTRWLSLFRAGSRAYCTQTECRLLARLTPHVQQALELNRLTHLNRSTLSVAGLGAQGTAIADLRGMLHHADPAFQDMLRAEWPGWGGHKLPEAALRHFQLGQDRHLGATVVLSHRTEHGLIFLKSRLRCAADSLTPREFTVARLMAKGNTHKQIAQLLQRSPATVRNQIRSVYDKLAVGNVAMLIEALRQAE